MIAKPIQNRLNEQVAVEFGSHYQYLSMAAHFQGQSMGGISHWFLTQAREEAGHAMKIYQYVLERGGTAELAAIPAPKQDWATVLEAFRDALAGEQQVSAKIGTLIDLAKLEKDHATEIFLQWFVTEQVEEESLVSDAVAQLELIEDSKVGLYMFDQKLSERPAPQPAP